jgi:prephenate dehydrogenase
LNKTEMIEAVAKSADISKAAAGRAVEAVISSVRSSLKKGQMVTMVGSMLANVLRVADVIHAQVRQLRLRQQKFQNLGLVKRSKMR